MSTDLVYNTKKADRCTSSIDLPDCLLEKFGWSQNEPLAGHLSYISGIPVYGLLATATRYCYYCCTFEIL